MGTWTYESKNTKINSEGLTAVYIKICTVPKFPLYRTFSIFFLHYCRDCLKTFPSTSSLMTPCCWSWHVKTSCSTIPCRQTLLVHTRTLWLCLLQTTFYTSLLLMTLNNSRLKSANHAHLVCSCWVDYSLEIFFIESVPFLMYGVFCFNNFLEHPWLQI